MDGTDSSIRCRACGGDHDDAIHASEVAAANELARACREVREDDVLVLDAHLRILRASAWLRARGHTTRAALEIMLEERRSAA